MLPVPELGGHSAITATDGRLAWEIASEIDSIPNILKKFGITPQEFKGKLRDQLFRSALREAKIIWKSETNVEQRIKIKARYLVEDSLLDVFAMLKNENLTAAPRLEAFEKLMRAADVVPRTGKAGEQAPGGGFKVTINLGDSGKNVTIDGQSLLGPAPIEATP
jgi:hypothetical protein